MRKIISCVILFLLLTIITGIVYPMAVTGISKILFPWKAQGSLIFNYQNKVIGSSLIGQQFSDSKYFRSRPSTTSDYSYNPMSSGGSQLGSTNPELAKQVSERIEKLRESGPTGNIPSDLVEASASGLDPHITLESAIIQIPRIAKTRNLSEENVRKIVTANLEGRELGFLGTPRVNVLKLNLALDNGRL